MRTLRRFPKLLVAMLVVVPPLVGWLSAQVLWAVPCNVTGRNRTSHEGAELEQPG
jgi:hypothetical protein